MAMLRQVLGKFAKTTVAANRLDNTLVIRTMSTSGDKPAFETLSVETVAPFVTHVTLNRPQKRNAMNRTFWAEMVECFRKLHEDEDCRSIVVSGAGRIFTAGLDISDMSDFFSIIQSDGDVARKAKNFYSIISRYQDSFTALEKCSKPIIVAVHGGCIGGGVDLISAADIRYCTQDAYFQIKEVDLGLAADVGTLQRMGKVVGNHSVLRELAYTGRNVYADEAKSMGFIGRIFSDQEAMMNAAFELAKEIAAKSPVAVQGTKINLNYSRDHTVDESLEYMARWNATMLQSDDLVKAATAMMAKEKPTFAKL